LAALLLAGGALGGLFCLLVFLLADVLSHVLQDRTCSEKERNARKVRSLTRVSTLLALAVSDRGLLGSAVLIQQVGGLLLGGAVQLLVEVREVLRDLPATGAHRLRVQAAGTVAGTNQRAGHDSREAHVISSLGVRHELLRAHPTVDREIGRAHV